MPRDAARPGVKGAQDKHCWACGVAFTRRDVRNSLCIGQKNGAANLVDVHRDCYWDGIAKRNRRRRRGVSEATR